MSLRSAGDRGGCQCLLVPVQGGPGPADQLGGLMRRFSFGSGRGDDLESVGGQGGLGSITGRPKMVPAVRAAAMPALTRFVMSSRSYSGAEPTPSCPWLGSIRDIHG